MGNSFVAMVMGKNFMGKSGTPILLCLVPRYDASGRVDDLSASQNKQCTSGIANGSAKGFS